MTVASLLSSIGDFYLYVIAAAFALSRMTGLMMIMPLFPRLGLTGILRSGVALALALPLVPILVEGLAGADPSVAAAGLLLFKEFVVGMALGLVLGVPIWAAEAAGDVLDLQRGATAGMLIDPSMTQESSITGTLFAIVMLALFFAAGGLDLVLRAVYDSYGLWPALRLTPLFTAEAGGLFLGLLDEVLGMAVVLVFPVIVCFLLSDLVLGLLARASPHFNVFALSLGVKSLVFSAVLVLYAIFLIAYMGDGLALLFEAPARLEAIADQEGADREGAGPGGVPGR